MNQAPLGCFLYTRQTKRKFNFNAVLTAIFEIVEFHKFGNFNILSYIVGKMIVKIH